MHLARRDRALDKQLGGVEEALIDALLPSKAGDLEQAKFAAPSRGIVYILDGVPILFDASGKGDLYVPTAMGLWHVPELLPQVGACGLLPPAAAADAADVLADPLAAGCLISCSARCWLGWCCCLLVLLAAAVVVVVLLAMTQLLLLLLVVLLLLLLLLVLLPAAAYHSPECFTPQGWWRAAFACLPSTP